MKPHDDKFTEIYNTVKEMYPNAQAVIIEINPGTIIVRTETMAYTLVEEGDGADKTLWRRHTAADGRGDGIEVIGNIYEQEG